MGPEPVVGGEKIGSGEVGGDERKVGLTTVKTGERRVGMGDSTPRVVKERGNGELGSPDGGGGGPERSVVGTFGETVGDHVGGKGEGGVIRRPVEAEEGSVHVILDTVGEGSVGVGLTDVEKSHWRVRGENPKSKYVWETDPRERRKRHGNGGVTETVEDQGGVVSEGDVVVTGLLEGIVGELDGFDDFVSVGLESEFAVENDAEVGEFGDFGDGETVGVEGEVFGEETRT